MLTINEEANKYYSRKIHFIADWRTNKLKGTSRKELTAIEKMEQDIAIKIWDTKAEAYYLAKLDWENYEGGFKNEE